LFHIFIHLSFFSNNFYQVDSNEEDVSDESMLARHEHGLRSMRERWTMIHRLKTETRRDNTYQKRQNIEGSQRSPYASSSIRHYRTYGNNSTNPLEDGFSSARDSVDTMFFDCDGANIYVDDDGDNSIDTSRNVDSGKSSKKRGRPPKLYKGLS
jgi:hypothetical protein